MTSLRFCDRLPVVVLLLDAEALDVGALDRSAITGVAIVFYLIDTTGAFTDVYNLSYSPMLGNFLLVLFTVVELLVSLYLSVARILMLEARLFRLDALIIATSGGSFCIGNYIPLVIVHVIRILWYFIICEHTDYILFVI